jgi:hypothetical protein
MQTRSSLFGLLGAAVALTCANLSAQISYSENYDAMTLFAAPTGYTSTGFFVFDTTTCTGSGQGIQSNLWTGQTASNTGTFLGVSTGNPIAFTFDYHVKTFASANTIDGVAPWGTIQVQLASSPVGPWTTIGTITDETQVGACIPKSFPATPTPGAVFFRFNCAWGGGDNYWNFDNLDVQETIPCTGTPNPGNTVGPVDPAPARTSR